MLKPLIVILSAWMPRRPNLACKSTQLAHRIPGTTAIEHAIVHASEGQAISSVYHGIQLHEKLFTAISGRAAAVKSVIADTGWRKPPIRPANGIT